MATKGISKRDKANKTDVERALEGTLDPSKLYPVQANVPAVVYAEVCKRTLAQSGLNVAGNGFDKGALSPVIRPALFAWFAPSVDYAAWQADYDALVKTRKSGSGAKISATRRAQKESQDILSLMLASGAISAEAVEAFRAKLADAS